MQVFQAGVIPYHAMPYYNSMYQTILHKTSLCTVLLPGWGEQSYARDIRIENNSISHIMQLLHDGGGVYTNIPCQVHLRVPITALLRSA